MATKELRLYNTSWSVVGVKGAGFNTILVSVTWSRMGAGGEEVCLVGVAWERGCS